MKTAGIVCDNYKLPEYRMRIAAIGFEIVSETPFIKNTTTIKIKYSSDADVQKIKTMCEDAELFFHARRN